MAQKTFTQDIFIAAKPEHVRTFMASLQNHHKIHPLILQISHQGKYTRPDGSQEDRYRIQDRIPLGPFRYTITYRTVVWINTEGEMISNAYQFPHIHLHNTMSFLVESDGTRLIERVEIDAPFLLMPTVYKQAQQSHQRMLENLKSVLESNEVPLNEMNANVGISE